MDNHWERYTSVLKSHGLSITTPRKEVFEVLYSFGLQTMNQLISRCKVSNRASIYRTVDSLEKIGVIVRVSQGFKYKLELSDALLPHHHHITCTSCGKIAEIDQTKLETLLIEIADIEGYKLITHKLDMGGLCNECCLSGKYFS